MTWTANRRMGLIALVIFVLDQGTKLLVLRELGPTQEKIMVPGFFKFVHWENSGAAWSLFHGRNGWLAVISFAALIGLYVWREHFYVNSLAGQCSLGLIFGGIAGNLFDRLYYHQVIDFLRFYLERHSGQEIGFPAFNIADSAICVGVGLLILVSWQREHGVAAGELERRAPVAEGFRADQ